MTDEPLREAWDRAVVRDPVDRRACPPPETLLSLAEAGVADRDALTFPDSVPALDPLPALDELADLATHLAGCRSCRREVQAARALLEAARPPAREAVSSSGSSWLRPRSWPLALAASLVLAGGTGLALWSLAGTGGTVRSGGAALEGPLVSCPVPGEIEVRWAEVDGASRYRVEVFGGAGDVVARGETAALELILPLETLQQPEAGPLLVRVEALRPGGRPLASPSTPLPPGCLPASSSFPG